GLPVVSSTPAMTAPPTVASGGFAELRPSAGDRRLGLVPDGAAGALLPPGGRGRRSHAARLDPAGEPGRAGGEEEQPRERREDDQRQRDRGRIRRAALVDRARDGP